MHALELTVIPSTAKDGLVIANHLDSASGVTRFATLEGALARLKEILNSANGRLPEGGVIIHLLSGTHRLEAPIRLTRAESGSEVVPIFLMGPADKSAVISGGRVLSRPSTIRDPLVLQRLPVRSRKSVVQYDLRAEGVDDFGSMIRRGWGQTTQPGQLELFYRGEPMNLARWPDPRLCFAATCAGVGRCGVFLFPAWGRRQDPCSGSRLDGNRILGERLGR